MGLFLLLAIVCPVLVFAMVHWYQNSVQDLPYYGKEYTLSDSKQNRFTVGDFAFKNESGSISDLDSMKGKVWVANYFFSYCKTICPIIMPNLEKVQKAFPKETNFKMISFTVDPERDSVTRLATYSKELGIDVSQWHLVTGEKKILYRYARNELFLTATDGDGGPDDFIHSDKIALIDREGHIRGYYDGTNSKDIQQLITDIRKILK